MNDLIRVKHLFGGKHEICGKEVFINFRRLRSANSRWRSANSRENLSPENLSWRSPELPESSSLTGSSEDKDLRSKSRSWRSPPLTGGWVQSMRSPRSREDLSWRPPKSKPLTGRLVQSMRHTPEPGDVYIGDMTHLKPEHVEKALRGFFSTMSDVTEVHLMPGKKYVFVTVKDIHRVKHLFGWRHEIGGEEVFIGQGTKASKPTNLKSPMPRWRSAKSREHLSPENLSWRCAESKPFTGSLLQSMRPSSPETKKSATYAKSIRYSQEIFVS